MQPNGHASIGHETDRGLPVVVPPSGKFIAQLFLVPFIIVASVVCFLLFVNWLVGSSRSPDDFLKKLDSPNTDVRWRAAEDLAQVVLRDDVLASDPKFGLDLTDRLEQALRDQPQADIKPAQHGAALQSQASIPAAIQSESDYVLYLSACLGNISLPTAAPLLSEMAEGRHGSGPDAIRDQWRALWVLANLGENLKRFYKLSPELQQTRLQQLEEEASASGNRGRYARLVLGYFRGPDAKSLRPLGIEKALTQSAEAPDPFLRTMAAFAMNFWEGTEAENARLESSLVKLAADDGHGEENLARIREAEGQPDESVTPVPGLRIRYNATVALARRGSPRARLDVIEEMLNEEKQRAHFHLRRTDGQESVDEATVSLTLVTALKAVNELHRRDPNRDLSAVSPAIDKLASNDNVALRSEAERTRLALAH